MCHRWYESNTLAWYLTSLAYILGSFSSPSENLMKPFAALQLFLLSCLILWCTPMQNALPNEGSSTTLQTQASFCPLQGKQQLKPDFRLLHFSLLFSGMGTLRIPQHPAISITITPKRLLITSGASELLLNNPWTIVGVRIDGGTGGLSSISFLMPRWDNVLFPEELTLSFFDATTAVNPEHELWVSKEVGTMDCEFRALSLLTPRIEPLAPRVASPSESLRSAPSYYETLKNGYHAARCIRDGSQGYIVQMKHEDENLALQTVQSFQR